MNNMRVVAQRIAGVVPMLVLVTALVFAITSAIPGDPALALAGEQASVAEIEAARERLGLDRPFVVRYVSWLGDAARGDLGVSTTDGREVSDLLATRLPPTLFLALGGLLVAAAVGVPLGVAAATKRGSLRDRLCLLVGTAGVAVPSFWLAMLLVSLFAVRLGWFPATGYVAPSESIVEWLRHLVLPVLALAAGGVAEIARQTRAAVSATLDADYVRTARMKGLPERRVVGTHALKNAALPIITTLGVLTTVLLGGSVIVERVFGVPGLGDLVVSSVSARNVPVIQGVALVTTAMVILVSLVADLVSVGVSPKVEVA